MADTTSLKDLFGSKDETSTLYDILNRKGYNDRLSEAFTEQGKTPAITGKQRLTNAFMRGLGAGFGGAADTERADRLKSLEGNLKQIVDQNFKLKKQLGKAELLKATFTNFAMSNYGDLKKMNDAIVNGDQAATNNLGVLLYNRFSEENPDITNNYGKIDHIYNGKAYFDKDSKIGGVYVKDLIEPLVSKLPLEQQKELSGLTSLTTQNNFKKSDLFEDLSLQEKRANIYNHTAAGNASNAHANLYNMEAESKQNSMLNPPKYDKNTTKAITSSNIEWIKTNNEQVKMDAQMANAYEKLSKIFVAESGGLGRGGNRLIAAMNRYYDNSNSESSRNEALAEMYTAPLMSGLKKYFTGATSDRDIEIFLKTLPSLKFDSKASIQIANERAKELRDNISDFEKRTKALEKLGYGELYNSEAVNSEMKKDETLEKVYE